MSKPKTYRIERISDLLNVPADRREECVKEILMGLSFSELTGTSKFLGCLEWTDDGDLSSTLVDCNGDTMLKMEITPN